MKRTTHRSSKGTKLYAVRNKKGQFEDIQTYKQRPKRVRRASKLTKEHIEETLKRFEKVMKSLADK